MYIAPCYGRFTSSVSRGAQIPRTGTFRSRAVRARTSRGGKSWHTWKNMEGKKISRLFSFALPGQEKVGIPTK